MGTFGRYISTTYCHIFSIPTEKFRSFRIDTLFPQPQYGRWLASWFYYSAVELSFASCSLLWMWRQWITTTTTTHPRLQLAKHVWSTLLAKFLTKLQTNRRSNVPTEEEAFGWWNGQIMVQIFPGASVEAENTSSLGSYAVGPRNRSLWCWAGVWVGGFNEVLLSNPLSTPWISIGHRIRCPQTWRSKPIWRWRWRWREKSKPLAHCQILIWQRRIELGSEVVSDWPYHVSPTKSETPLLIHRFGR